MSEWRIDRLSAERESLQQDIRDRDADIDSIRDQINALISEELELKCENQDAAFRMREIDAEIAEMRQSWVAA